MARYQVIRSVYGSEDEPVRELNVRLHVRIVSPGSLSSSSSAPSGNEILLFDAANQFLAVCSPIDLQRWPAITPDPDSGLVRRDEGDWYFRDEELLEQFWALLIADIESLSNALERLDRLSVGEMVSLDTSPSESPGTRSLDLTRDAVSPYPDAAPTHYRLRVSCTGINQDARVFLHRYELPDRDDTIRFRPVSVCSPADMVEYPPDAPNSEQFPAFFRRSEFDIISRDLALLENGWNNLRYNVETLAAALRAHDRLLETSEVEA